MAVIYGHFALGRSRRNEIADQVSGDFLAEDDLWLAHLAELEAEGRRHRSEEAERRRTGAAGW